MGLWNAVIFKPLGMIGITGVVFEAGGNLVLSPRGLTLGAELAPEEGI
jgi:hypothetical protein